MSITKLPEIIQDALVTASAVIGPERALIALQGIVCHAKPVRIIDGVMRQETIDAVNKAISVSGLETVAAAYVEKIEHRFPGTFQVEDEEDDTEDLEPVVAVSRSRKKSDG